MRAKAFVGTSGYNYGHWGGGVFYPPELPQREWLEYYARHFSTVELNVTFYRLPALPVFQGWKKRTPARFAFAVKGSRYITHIKRLKDCREPIMLFLKNASGLGRKLNVILWQLHPGMKCDSSRLENFCSMLKRSVRGRRIRHAFEFRHPSWFCDEVYGLLHSFNHALCIADSPIWPRVEAVTADWIYLRFHGGRALYGSNYSDGELGEWAAKARAWLAAGRAVFAYFNNDAHGFAVRNALRLRELIEGGRAS
jgi:uncharacterized protein YecE (DUF72 family)